MTKTKEGYYLWDHTNQRSIPTAAPDGEPNHFFVTPEMAAGCACRELMKPKSPVKEISIRRMKGDPDVDADFIDDFILRLER